MVSSSPRQPSVSVYFVIAEDFKWPRGSAHPNSKRRSSAVVAPGFDFEKIDLMQTR